MKRWLAVRLLAVLLLAWLPAAGAQWSELSFVDPGLRWRTLETASFAVHFAERNRDQARTVAGTAERVLPRITSLLRWRPAARIHVVVLDSADFATGLASPLPFNYAMIFLSPPDEGARPGAGTTAGLRARAVLFPERPAAAMDHRRPCGACRVGGSEQLRAPG